MAANGDAKTVGCMVGVVLDVDVRDTHVLGVKNMVANKDAPTVGNMGGGPGVGRA